MSQPEKENIDFKAAAILDPSHPLHKAFVAWVNKRSQKNGSPPTPTTRMARKYLAPMRRRAA
jgi:hypothetical protein